MRRRSPPLHLLLLLALCEATTAFTIPQQHCSGSTRLTSLWIRMSLSSDNAADTDTDAVIIPVDILSSSTGTNNDLKSKSSKPLKGGKDYQKVLNTQLKRNLIQETISAYKKELLVELSRGRLIDDETAINTDSKNSNSGLFFDFDESVKDKLTSLIQVNPVSTTTDSNLLEGEWELAYIAPSAVEVLNATPARLDVRNKSKRKRIETREKIAPPRKRDQLYSAMSSFLSSAGRNFVLENLEEDEDPYLIEYLRIIGGFIQYRRKYLINGLTRTSLDVVWNGGSKQLSFGPLSIGLGKTNSGKGVLEIFYLDNDLCISMTDFGRNGPIFVYTKSEDWTNVDSRARRRIRSVLNLSSMIHSPLNLRQRIKTISKIIEKKHNEKDADKMVVQKETNTSKLKVLKIGDPSEIIGMEVNDDSWEGEEDPFVHLDAATRQEVMKKMSIREINEAGKRQKQESRTSGTKLDRNRPKRFRPPKNE